MIKVIFCGDYEFLCMAYHELVVSQNTLKIPIVPKAYFITIRTSLLSVVQHSISSQLIKSLSTRVTISLKTNATLEWDLKSFQDDGENIKKAKLF